MERLAARQRQSISNRASPLSSRVSRVLRLRALQLMWLRYVDDGDYASENATRNIFNWYKETEDGGIWLDMGSDLETRKYHMHPWIYRESSELGSDTSDVSDSGVPDSFDRVQVQKWIDDKLDALCEERGAPPGGKQNTHDTDVEN